MYREARFGRIYDGPDETHIINGKFHKAFGHNNSRCGLSDPNLLLGNLQLRPAFWLPTPATRAGTLAFAKCVPSRRVCYLQCSWTTRDVFFFCWSLDLGSIDPSKTTYSLATRRRFGQVFCRVPPSLQPPSPSFNPPTPSLPMASASSSITPWVVPEYKERISELGHRLAFADVAAELPDCGWEYGVPRDVMLRWIKFWKDEVGIDILELEGREGPKRDDSGRHLSKGRRERKRNKKVSLPGISFFPLSQFSHKKVRLASSTVENQLVPKLYAETVRGKRRDQLALYPPAVDATRRDSVVVDPRLAWWVFNSLPCLYSLYNDDMTLHGHLVGSFIEFAEMIRPLAEPEDPNQQAFHVVVPSLPGYGFSEAPKKKGYGPIAISKAFAELMTALGYEQFASQGGDQRISTFSDLCSNSVDAFFTWNE